MKGFPGSRCGIHELKQQAEVWCSRVSCRATLVDNMPGRRPQLQDGQPAAARAAREGDNPMQQAAMGPINHLQGGTVTYAWLQKSACAEET